MGTDENSCIFQYNSSNPTLNKYITVTYMENQIMKKGGEYEDKSNKNLR